MYGSSVIIWKKSDLRGKDMRVCHHGKKETRGMVGLMITLMKVMCFCSELTRVPWGREWHKLLALITDRRQGREGDGVGNSMDCQRMSEERVWEWVSRSIAMCVILFMVSRIFIIWCFINLVEIFPFHSLDLVGNRLDTSVWYGYLM